MLFAAVRILRDALPGCDIGPAAEPGRPAAPAAPLPGGTGPAAFGMPGWPGKPCPAAASIASCCRCCCRRAIGCLNVELLLLVVLAAGPSLASVKPPGVLARERCPGSCWLLRLPDICAFLGAAAGLPRAAAAFAALPVAPLPAGKGGVAPAGLAPAADSFQPLLGRPRCRSCLFTA